MMATAHSTSVNNYACYRTFSIFLIIIALWGTVRPAATYAQGIQHTSRTSDFVKRSELRVDPSTLGLNIEITLNDYPGRGGTGLPVTLYYSSKVWRINYIQSGSGLDNYRSWTEPKWTSLEGSASGWTSSLGVPKVLETGYQEFYDANGAPVGSCYPACWLVRRVQIIMPDGSSHELRHSSPTAWWNPAGQFPSFSGMYYAVDSSRLRYDFDSRTLYLPNGSRYVIGSNTTPTTYIDRNGNTLTYNPSSNQWTDTLGRTITAPPIPQVFPGLPANPVPGDYAYSIPGVGASLTYTFRWRTLSDARTNPSEPLQNMGDCSDPNYPGSYYPALFVSGYPDSVCGAGTFNPAVLYEIVLPNGRAYRFTYNSYGEIDKVTYPTGGYERYLYGQIQTADWVRGVYEQGNRGVIERWVSPSGTGTDEARWQYSAGYADINYSQPYKVTITAPDNTRTQRLLHTAAQDYLWGFRDVRISRAYEERTYSASNQMLRRTLTEWVGSNQGSAANARDPRVNKQVEIMLDTGGNALASTITYQYDADLNVITTNKYDFAPVDQYTAQNSAIGSIPSGTLLRIDEATYLVNDPTIDSGTQSAYRARNLVSLPTLTRVKNASGTIVAQTELRYDEAAYPLLTYGVVTSWINPATTIRGNATTVRRWLNTSGTYLETHSQYDQCGSLRNSWDAKGNLYQTEYSSSYHYAYPTRTLSPVPDTGNGCCTTTPLETTTAYDFQTGLVTSTTDANGNVTTFQYNDALNRPTAVLRPGGGRTTYSYFDTHYCGPFVETKTLLDSTGRETDDYVFFDGLGRSVRTFKYDGQNSGAPYLTTDAQYDAMGRVMRVSNPYRSSGCTAAVNPSGNWTTTTYDTLGRVKTVTTPDSAQVVTTYSGNQVMVQDQMGRKRQSVADALGRLTQVIEDPAGLAYQTTYSYDALGHLRVVTQGSQHRYFMYDSLSRLIRAKTPEQDANPNLALSDPISGNSQWSMAYAYDANGNLSSRTDARGVTATYTYDNINRNIAIIYSDGSSVNRYWDGATNGRGRLWLSYAYTPGYTRGEHWATDGYDAMGRPLNNRRQFYNNSGGWSTAYTSYRSYDLAGNVISQTYPSGRTVNYTYDQAGRTSSFTGNLGDGVARTYAGSISYDEWNGLSREQFGTDTPLYHKERRNIRGQLYDMRLSTVNDADNWNRGAIVNYYSFQPVGFGTSGPDNNGNLLMQQNWIPSDDAISSYSFMQQNYGYDALNRLNWVGEYQNGTSYTGAQAQNLDRYGNRTVGSFFGAGINGQQFAIDTNTNRLGVPAGQPGVMQYDANGNLINDTYSGAGSRSYDAENRMVSATNYGGMPTVYTYDADGHRTRRNSYNQETWHVYGFDGELLAEYGAGASPSQPQKEYGYRNGQLLVSASGQSCGVGYQGTKTWAATSPSLGHLTGHQEGSEWVVTAGSDSPNTISYGPYDNSFGQGRHTARFLLKVDNTNGSDIVATLDVVTGFGQNILVKRQVRRNEFAAANQWQWFTLEFDNPCFGLVEARIYWHGTINMRLSEVTITGVNSNGTVLQWMVTDQLGTPRIIADKTGSLSGIKRHDYLPFGEELFAGTGGRTEQQGYVADTVRQQFTGKERDSDTGLDYFLARYYSPTQGRFTSVDPREISFEVNRAKFLAYIGNPQNWNRYSYVLNNPLALTNPDGREPNKNQAVTIQQIIAIIQQTERDNPDAGPREILQRVDGYFRAQQAGPGNPRYVYTLEKGWIDFRHFFAAANQAADYGEVITDALGVGVEVYQTVTRSTSAFSYEDLPSNSAGADFGDDYFDPNGRPLSQQVANYLDNLRPVAPTSAPNYNSLPTVEDLGSRTSQSARSRTIDSGTASAQGRTGSQSSGRPPGGTVDSSRYPQNNRRVNSSGTQRRNRQ